MVVSEKQGRNLYLPAMFVELDCTKKCCFFCGCFFVQNWLLLWSFSSDLQNMRLTNNMFEAKTTTTTWTSLRCLKRFHVITIGLHVIFKYLFHITTLADRAPENWWLWDDPFLIRFRVSIFPSAGKALKAVVHNFLVRLLGVHWIRGVLRGELRPSVMILSGGIKISYLRCETTTVENNCLIDQTIKYINTYETTTSFYLFMMYSKTRKCVFDHRSEATTFWRFESFDHWFSTTKRHPWLRWLLLPG